MAGQFPTALNDLTATWEVISYQPSFFSTSQSGRDTSRLSAGHKWQIKITPHDLRSSELAAFEAFLMRQKGRHSAFTLALPGYAPLGTVNGLPTVTSVTDDNTVVLGGFNSGDEIKAGDLFTFAGHTKMYKCVIDASESAGALTCVFEPALIATPAALEAVEFNSPVFTMRNDLQRLSFTRRGVWHSFQLSFTESY